VICQVACAHLLRRVGVSIIAGILSGLAATAAGAAFGLAPAYTPGRSLPVLAMTLATYLALAFGYWTFVNLNITSLRIRVLREILGSDDGISRSELLTRYSAEEFLRRRLERLKHIRQMSCTNGYWRLESPTLLVLAQTMAALRLLVLPSKARPGRD
jgi:hypothetical protein